MQKGKREDHKKARELEELRKAGTIPPEVDEDGNTVNPHIPQYMSQAPWYLDQKVGLKHQKGWMEKVTLKGVEARNVVDFRANKKGVSRTRDEFGELVETTKPGRRRGGKQELSGGAGPRDNGYDNSYDGKHDRWNGYDTAQYKQVMDRYENIDNARRKLKSEELEKKLAEKKKKKEAKKDKAGADSDSDSDDESGDDADDVKIKNEDQAMGQKFDNHEGGSKGFEPRCVTFVFERTQPSTCTTWIHRPPTTTLRADRCALTLDRTSMSTKSSMLATTW
eukprot:TRINITY_DN26169_c0_g1_i2.p1 TRINITY_DN26169_c0_g1~~TRINITY_DN26169_c0_g1_i2.p1  ORF type:complete len:279 (+),score=33.54 TRINITY_DN26169_c0_g1_i2:3-839(+)